MDILIVDDQPAMREEIASLVAAESDLNVVALAESGEEAVEKAAALHPDLVVMDLALPGMTGLEASRLIQRKSPDSRILAFSNHTGRSLVEAALMAGIAGYVCKDRGYEELIPAIRKVAQGGKYFSASVD